MIRGVKNIYVFLLLFFLQTNGYCQEDFIVKADLLFSEGKYYDATDYYEKALVTNKSNPNLYIKLAKCHLLVSPRSNALKYINKAIELVETPTLEMYYILGRAYHVNNEFDKAIESYKESDPEKNNFENLRKFSRECLNAKRFFSNPKTVEIINLGETINSDHQEYLPYITADHLQLFFTSTRTGQEVIETNEHEQHEDIYTSKFEDGKWTKPAVIAALNDLEGHDACVGISEDGQTMFVYKGTNGGDLYTSKLEGDNWTEVKSLSINTPGFEGAASLSPDGNILYFIHSEGTSHDRDIYYCTKTIGGKWSKALPITELNTPYDEESPFIHPDGKTLYFSSKGHTTMGGYDIFKSVRNHDGTWSEPQNIGYPINSTGDDVYFVLSADGHYGFYASDKEGGFGKQDIYSLKMDKDLTTQLELLKGEVRDEAGKAMEADIIVTDNRTQKVVSKFKSNSENGRFLISLPCGENYGIHIEKEGYIFHSEHAQIDCKTGYEEVFTDVKLKKVHAGAKIILNNIFFDSGESELKSESNTELQKLVSLLKINPTIKIEISGYTDNVGEEAANLTLSQQRADHVTNYLINQGVNKTRLSSKGFGSNQSVSTNETEAGRRLNRRTEFKIL